MRSLENLAFKFDSLGYESSPSDEDIEAATHPILTTKGDWSFWFDQIQLRAQHKSVWEYVDPDRQEEPPEKPEFPDFEKDLKALFPNVQTREDLDKEQRNTFYSFRDVRWTEYEILSNRYRRAQEGLAVVLLDISRSVNPQHRHCLIGIDSPQEALRKLRKNI
ncbi:hypothetical protein BDV59DRAFT_197600 [Aspergillus ambiguus]|uniref:uncharacterized protein n=1 Tax=Aspergillus ambiguus TaxID=176160 RepID=UPI003CCDE340